jgi:NADH dehydrogenase
MKKKLLIIGGGFAGFWSAMSAIRQSRAIQKEADLEITLVNPDNYLTIRPRLYEASLEGLRVQLDTYLLPLGVKQVVGRAEVIDPIGKKVTVFSQQGTRTLEYDYLILASGSQLKWLDIPGFEHTFNMDSFQGAQILDEHVKTLAENNFTAPGAKTFVVVGGGLTGLEAATSIEEKATLLALRSTPGAIEFKVILIEKEEQLAGIYSTEAQQYILQTLSEKRIEVITGSYMTQVTPDKIVLMDGTEISSATVIWCGGIVASPLTGFFEGSKDVFGRLQVDKYLKLPGYDNIIIAGDVANVPLDDEGNISLMACQFSMDLGKWAGNNAVNDIFSQELSPYFNERYVTCLDLGQNDGLFTTGWERSLLYKGREGKDIKEQINQQLIYPGGVEEAVEASRPVLVIKSKD